jgi:D-inositol-3-phosphate glycosyltransferase
MRKLLWIGDGCCPSGFARTTHSTLGALPPSWEIALLALNYRGDPHLYPYRVYPATGKSFLDTFGLQRVKDLCEIEKPDVIVVQNDPWNIPAYMEQIKDIPVVATMPVDGENCNGKELNGLSMAIFWTDFGLKEARKGGYTGPATVIPLGVDTEVFQPLDRVEARKIIKLPGVTHKKFIVGNFNRNQVRKRLDLSISFFADWIKKYQIEDAMLFLYVAPTGDIGYECRQLAQYFGISDQMILFKPDVYTDIGSRALRTLYCCLDVQVTTSTGEGWGLHAMEGMACGIPQILPLHSAYSSWPGNCCNA